MRVLSCRTEERFFLRRRASARARMPACLVQHKIAPGIRIVAGWPIPAHIVEVRTIPVDETLQRCQFSSSVVPWNGAGRSDQPCGALAWLATCPDPGHVISK